MTSSFISKKTRSFLVSSRIYFKTVMILKNFDSTPNLRVVAETLGINYLATTHMYDLSVVNETLIIEDLRKGLIFEWLVFINLHLLDYPSDFEHSVMKLFSDDLDDFVQIDVTMEELDKMFDDRSYAGLMKVINSDHILFRLTLTQYLKLLKIGSKS